MKKIILSLLITFFIVHAHAQENDYQNKIIAGGLVNIFTQTNSYPISGIGAITNIGGIFSSRPFDSKNTNFIIGTYIGKEINKNLAVGVELNYAYGNYESEIASLITSAEIEIVDFERITHQFGFGIFSRHILNPNNKLKFYLQPYASFNLINGKQFEDSTMKEEEKTNFLVLGIGPGFIYDLNDKLRLRIRSGGLTYLNGNFELLSTNEKRNFSSFSTSLNLSSMGFGVELSF